MRYIIATTNLKKNKDPKDPLGEKIFLRTPPPKKKKRHQVETPPPVESHRQTAWTSTPLSTQ